jgi:hypothetical protein
MEEIIRTGGREKRGKCERKRRKNKSYRKLNMKG